ncbi:undecaprenyl-phosphate glucose phosphotransferase [Marinomonas agarivorans]|nr:undecaprenyl-phosphate glucose phosphotransferase [Marinomonas agarivorans]
MHFYSVSHDIICVFVAAFIFHHFCLGSFNMSAKYMIATAIIALTVASINLSDSNYLLFSRKRFIFSVVIKFFAFCLITDAAISFFFYLLGSNEPFNHEWLAFTLICSFVLLNINRLLFKGLIWRARAKGKYRRSVFLIGSSASVLSLGQRMKRYRYEGFSIAGVQRLHSSPKRELIDNIAERVRQSDAAEVWICLPLEMGRIVKTILYKLRNETAEIRFLPEFSDELLLNHRASEVVGRYSIDLSVTPISGYSRLLKRIEDIVVGGLIFILISPVCLVIAIAIKLTSPGPVLFKQYRTGANGRHFKVYKFRSMHVHEEKNSVTQAVKNDIRVTKLGRFLRQTSLDELPQFFNVLQGHMSIVGPRPHALNHNEYYKNLVESYMRRHMVKPGITGWAQMSGYRGETDTLEKMQKRVEHDLWYIDNWSVRLDIKIIVLTIFKGFINKNAY